MKKEKNWFKIRFYALFCTYVIALAMCLTYSLKTQSRTENVVVEKETKKAKAETKKVSTHEESKQKAKSKNESRSKKETETKVEPEPKKEKDTEPSKIYLGEFRITRYCRCEICNGPWVDQPTASGTELTDGRTIAVDSSVIPLGTKVYIEGVGERIAEDTGSAIIGDCIDLFVDVPHNEAEDMGVTYNDVYIIE